MENKSTIIKAVLGIVTLIVLLFFNPLSYNDAGERTVVEQFDGKQFAKYQGNMVPYYQSGGSNGGNGGINFMELMGAKAAKDLSLELRNK
jgi:hypothetical protein